MLVDTVNRQRRVDGEAHTARKVRALDLAFDRFIAPPTAITGNSMA